MLEYSRYRKSSGYAFFRELAHMTECGVVLVGMPGKVIACAVHRYEVLGPGEP